MMEGQSRPSIVGASGQGLALRMNDGKHGGSDNERFNTSTEDHHSVGHDEHSTDEYKRDLKKGNNNILVHLSYLK
jgi:hypothetical protein